MTTATLSPDLIESAKRVDLIALASQYTQLRKCSGTKELEGPCPKCGGSKRFKVQAEWFFCRDCYSFDNGQPHDSIAFVRWLNGCSFVEAVERLTGAKPMTQTSVKQIKPAVKSQPAQPSDWAEKAGEIVTTAQNALWVGLNEGTAYLDSRGIEAHAWGIFGLGLSLEVALPNTWNAKAKTYSTPRQPAIVIPWYRGGKLVAIRYRFLQKHTYIDADGKEATAKQTAHYESDFTGLLYGGQALAGCAEDVRTLVLCEGELNAISIWQMAEPWNWDVLSLGSESAKLTPAMLGYAAKFERVIIWMDREELVKELMAQIPLSYGISSAVIDGVKQDANRLLQTEQLGGVLAGARYQACRTDDERRRLFYNINDAIARRHVDVGACEVAMQIAAKVGIKL